jgi:branched-chain amino acid aminotransferase
MGDYIQANTDGRLHSADRPSISPLDRGFLYGDAIYEVWRTYDGIVFAWDEHWQRLEASAQALGLALPLTQTEMFRQIRRTVSAYCRKTGARPEVSFRLQITRGAGAIGLNPALADRSRYVLLVQALKEMTAEQRAAGIRLGLATELHRNHAETLNPRWKTGNYLNNILCLREVLARGAEEVVMTNLAGEITESAVSNIFFVRDGVLHTPPLSAGMLAGITRAAVLGPVAAAAGVSVRETVIRPEDLSTFSECFLTGTRREIHPVNAIDKVRYTLGPQTVTARLQSAFAGYTRDDVQRHKKLRVWPPLRG